MTVTTVQQDSASLELHMEVGREEFRKLSEMLTVTAIEVCGSIHSRERTIRHPSGGSDATSERRRVRRDDHHAAKRRSCSRRESAG
jgi:hypothetical protein